MNEWLKSLGFTYAGNCNCSGSRNEKYKRGEWMVYITRSKFKVKRYGTTVKGYADIEGLKIYLQKAIPSLFAGR